MKKKIAAVLEIGILVLGLLGGCALPARNRSVSRSGFYFDTIITITLYGTEDERYIDHCFALAKKYEDMFSVTVSDSEISRINAHAGAYVTVSDETIALLQKGIEYGRLSGGKFDITLGALSELWNIPEISARLPNDENETDASVLPDASDIEAARSHVDYRKIEIDQNRVRLADPDARLDLGGIAKGYIADQMKAYLNEEGITSGTINLGGNVLTIGNKADASFYRIGIQKPFGETGETAAVLETPDASIVSSGIYERYYRIDGRIYHHILDVDTGYPYQNHLYGVTVISPLSVDGDALSTTCFALGLEKGMELVESLDAVEAVFLTDDGALHISSGLVQNGETITMQQ